MLYITPERSARRRKKKLSMAKRCDNETQVCMPRQLKRKDWERKNNQKQLMDVVPFLSLSLFLTSLALRIASGGRMSGRLRARERGNTITRSRLMRLPRGRSSPGLISILVENKWATRQKRKLQFVTRLIEIWKKDFFFFVLGIADKIGQFCVTVICLAGVFF